MGGHVELFEGAILALDRVLARRLLTESAGGSGARRGAEELLTLALERIGRRWEAGEVALAQIYMAGRICEELADSLPEAAERERPPQPRLALAVLEDRHFLGKRMVLSHLRASGYEPIDYGHQDAAGLARLANGAGIEVLLVSTLMLPSALKVAELRRKLDPGVKLGVGGAPFRIDERLWREVGADAMGRGASDAADMVRRLAEGAR